MSAKDLIAKCLGAFWILDGLLQFQPAMFGQKFVVNILVPNLSAQPHWMYDVVNFGIYLWNLDPALNNFGVGLLQVGIGLLLLLPLENNWFKFGAWVSIVWGVVVWFCGEGAGQLFTGIASFYTGAPGAVLLYVLLAALFLVPHLRTKQFIRIAAFVFISGSILQFQTAFWTADGVSGTAMAAMMETVHALNAFPIYIADLLGSHVAVANWLLTLAPLAIGAWLLLKPNRLAGFVSLTFLFFVWWIGQDFGMLSTFPTGTATDPNTAPLLALFLIPLFVTVRSKTASAYSSNRCNSD
jgi:hypothetical protein